MRTLSADHPTSSAQLDFSKFIIKLLVQMVGIINTLDHLLMNNAVTVHCNYIIPDIFTLISKSKCALFKTCHNTSPIFVNTCAMLIDITAFKIQSTSH